MSLSFILQEFRCPFENSCKIDSVTRRFCQKCRLKKCLDIGMKKEFIMSEEERTVKRKKIEENRMKKSKPTRGSTLTSGSTARQLVRLLNGGGAALMATTNQAPGTNKSDLRSSEAESSYSESDVSPSPLLDNSSESFQDLAAVKLASGQGLQRSSAAPESNQAVPSPSQQALKADPALGEVDQLFGSLDSTMDTILNTAIRSEYNIGLDLIRGIGPEGPYSPLSPVRDRPLNEVERAKLQELVVANKALLAPLTEDGPVNLHYDSGDPTLLNVINLTDIAIRRIIKMAKKLAAFKTLCQEDQIALLKGGCTELMILRSVMTYDADKGCWKVGPTARPP